MRKYLIDMSHYRYCRDGITQVWDSILAEWKKSAFYKQVLLVDRGNLSAAAIGFERVELAYCSNDFEADKLDLQRICDGHAIDGFMSTSDTSPVSTKTLQLVHDFIVEDGTYPSYPPDVYRKHRAMNQASRIIAVSQTTADRIPAFLQDKNKPIRVVHNASDLTEESNPGNLSSVMERPYFLHVGGLYGYKNSTIMFNAISSIPEEDRSFGLVLTQTPNEELAAQIPNDLETLSGRFDRVLLPRIYGRAIALVHTSYMEGFGLPLVEAMACGCPVICCDNAINREIAGNAAMYYSGGPAGVAQLTAALTSIQDPELRQSMRLKGLARARDFSWEKSANAYALELGLL